MTAPTLAFCAGDFGGYNLLTNNCEHFAFWCATGKRTSRQVYFLNDDQDIVEKALDRAFEPLIVFGDFVDRLFGWGITRGVGESLRDGFCWRRH